jgi:peptidoglycan/xylan/chitin deacetylase (PgdA/CDA1 family)
MKKWLSIVIAVLAISALAGCGTRAAEPSIKANTEAGTAGTQQPGADNTAPAPAPAPEPSSPSDNNSAGTPSPGNNDGGSADPAAAEPDTSSSEQSVKALYRMNSVYRFEPIASDTPKKVVLLTFDDGPKEKEMLTSLLDTLDKHNAKAIFFVNGFRVKQNPDLLGLIKERGQTIGNHSWDHIDLKQEKPEIIAKQIGDVQQIVEKVTGEKPRFFRPPFGSGGDQVREVASKEKLLFMTWSNGSLDWDKKSTHEKPELVVKSVLDQLHPGANILMHELPWTAKALDQLLTKLEDKGYGFIDPATIAPPGDVQNAE